MKLFFFWSFSLHILCLSPFFLKKQPQKSKKQIQRLEVFTVSNSLKNKQSLQSFSKSSRNKRPLKKNFSLKNKKEPKKNLLRQIPLYSSTQKNFTGATKTFSKEKASSKRRSSDTTSFSEDTISSSSYINVYTSTKDLRFLQKLSELMQEKITYEDILTLNNLDGIVKIKSSFHRKTFLNLKKLRVKSPHKYLSVYALKNYLEICQQHKKQLLSLLKPKKNNLEIEISIHFQQSSKKSIDRNPPPKISQSKIEILRYQYKEAQVFAKSNSFETKVANFDLGSLFSKEYREEHGFSGAKKIQAKNSKQEYLYKRLYKKYLEKGYIEI